MTTKTPIHEVLTTAHPASVTDLGDQIEAFLNDPIGYGVFDYDDPITLSEFATTRHHRGLFAAPLAF